MVNVQPPKIRAPWPPANYGDDYDVEDYDDWHSVAAKYGIDVKKLIYFNFKTNDFKEINWYLHEYVGCTQPGPRGHNYSFRGATKRKVYIPRGYVKKGVAQQYTPPDIRLRDGVSPGLRDSLKESIPDLPKGPAEALEDFGDEPGLGWVWNVGKWFLEEVAQGKKIQFAGGLEFGIYLGATANLYAKRWQHVIRYKLGRRHWESGPYELRHRMFGVVFGIHVGYHQFPSMSYGDKQKLMIYLYDTHLRPEEQARVRELAQDIMNPDKHDQSIPWTSDTDEFIEKMSFALQRKYPSLARSFMSTLQREAQRERRAPF